ncbi:MAG: TIGR01459 family HAD-type hydrolase [Alphaproteobacteria bacterium]|nr:TIGR01459 family HAD-type hydrolase [Alphaproteobacteria bacterium]
MPQPHAAPQPISGLAEVAGLYDGVILDLWGVVHDGVAPFPDTLPTLAALKKAKRKVWLLSNAPRRAAVIAARLEEMGIAPDMYGGLLTSGEASWQALRDGLLEQWGKRCLHIGSPMRDHSLYDGLDIEIVADPARADFILNSGVEDFSDPADKYMPLLKDCFAHNLPMLCANPDKIVHVQEQLVVCAGTLAESYALMGGEVLYYGKPYRGVYSRCLRDMGTDRVLAVGDAMQTDIAGATGAGLDSVLVTSGIHRAAFSPAAPQKDFFAGYLFRPNYTAARFCW